MSQTLIIETENAAYAFRGDYEIAIIGEIVHVRPMVTGPSVATFSTFKDGMIKIRSIGPTDTRLAQTMPIGSHYQIPTPKGEIE